MKKLVYLFVIMLGFQISVTYADQAGSSPSGASDCNGGRTAKEKPDAPVVPEGGDKTTVKEDSAVKVEPQSE